MKNNNIYIVLSIIIIILVLFIIYINNYYIKNKNKITEYFSINNDTTINPFQQKNNIFDDLDKDVKNISNNITDIKNKISTDNHNNQNNQNIKKIIDNHMLLYKLKGGYYSRR